MSNVATRVWETTFISAVSNGERLEQVMKSRYAGAGLMFHLTLTHSEYESMPERSYVIVKATAKGEEYATALFKIVDGEWTMEKPLWSPEADEAFLEDAIISFVDREVLKYAPGQARDRLGRFASNGGGTMNAAEVGGERVSTIEEFKAAGFKQISDTRPATPWRDTWTKSSQQPLTALQINAYRARTTAAMRRADPNITDKELKEQVELATFVYTNAANKNASSGIPEYSLKSNPKIKVVTSITDESTLDNLLHDTADFEKRFPMGDRPVRVEIVKGDNLGTTRKGTVAGQTALAGREKLQTPVTDATNGTRNWVMELEPSELRSGLFPKPDQSRPIKITLPEDGVIEGYKTIDTNAVGTNWLSAGNFHMAAGFVPHTTSIYAHEWGHAWGSRFGRYAPNWSGRQPYVKGYDYLWDSPQFTKLYNESLKVGRVPERKGSGFIRNGNNGPYQLPTYAGMSDYGATTKAEGFAELVAGLYLSERFFKGTRTDGGYIGTTMRAPVIDEFEAILGDM